LRRKRDAEKDPVSKVKRREEGRAFQREEPVVAKDLVWEQKEPTSLKTGVRGRCEVADNGERM